MAVFGPRCRFTCHSLQETGTAARTGSDGSHRFYVKAARSCSYRVLWRGVRASATRTVWVYQAGGHRARFWTHDRPQRVPGSEIQAVRIEYFRDTDTLCIELAQRPGADALEVADGIVVDVDECREHIERKYE